jgi:hypothetical protein
VCRRGDEARPRCLGSSPSKTTEIWDGSRMDGCAPVLLSAGGAGVAVVVVPAPPVLGMTKFWRGCDELHA